MMMLIAHDIAANPDLYNLPVLINNKAYECMGYTLSGKSIKFSRLIALPGLKVKQVNKYLKPDTPIILYKD